MATRPHPERGRPKLADNPPLERITTRIPERDCDDLERLVETGRYGNRSDAVRAAIGELLERELGENDAA